MNYKSIIIRERTVDGIKGKVVAYELVDPTTGHTLGLYGSLERAKQIIDKNGQRWLKFGS
ncbi:hypothetical protein GCM10028825_46940 [Spirosoma agri]|uniref:WGR domain-containing protein n=1 Tax=Spirosoma agri TaxID=1987381 RepID=A0A6M0IJY0_9BACT|nr:hypothetical protein [Spirosoma agri]NEU68616.1 hypothetical protein [Spirosoma agri]